MDVTFSYSLSPEQQQNWLEFWEKADHSHPRQHFAMGQIEVAKGRRPIFVMGNVADTPVIVAIFSIRPLWFRNQCSLEALCLSGPVFDDPVYLAPFLKEVVAYFKKQRVGQITISPYWFYPEAEAVKDELKAMKFSPIGMPRPTGIVDLRKSEEEILLSFSKKTRGKIRKLKEFPITIYPVTTIAEAQPLYDCLFKMRSERGILQMSWNEFKVTCLTLQNNPEIGACIAANYKQTFMAGRIILCGPRYAHSFGYAVNYEAARAFAKITFGCSLFWWSYLWAKKQGCYYFDVEGYDQNAEPTHPLYSIYAYKQQFKPSQVYRLEPFVCRCNIVSYLTFKGSTLPCKVGRQFRRPSVPE
jgi:lipid II:glycine glycyltransferase (peptidoglycan interpeptide bridge formation enzyme)